MQQGQINIAMLAGLVAPFGGVTGALPAAGSQHLPGWFGVLAAAVGFGIGVLMSSPIVRIGHRLLFLQFNASVPRFWKAIAFAVYFAWPLVAIFGAVIAAFAVVYPCALLLHGLRTAA